MAVLKTILVINLILLFGINISCGATQQESALRSGDSKEVIYTSPMLLKGGLVGYLLPKKIPFPMIRSGIYLGSEHMALVTRRADGSQLSVTIRDIKTEKDLDTVVFVMSGEINAILLDIPKDKYDLGTGIFTVNFGETELNINFSNGMDASPLVIKSINFVTSKDNKELRSLQIVDLVDRRVKSDIKFNIKEAALLERDWRYLDDILDRDTIIGAFIANDELYQIKSSGGVLTLWLNSKKVGSVSMAAWMKSVKNLLKISNLGTLRKNYQDAMRRDDQSAMEKYRQEIAATRTRESIYAMMRDPLLGKSPRILIQGGHDVHTFKAYIAVLPFWEAGLMKFNKSDHKEIRNLRANIIEGLKKFDRW